MSENCVFCRIANKSIPSKIIKETDNLICFPDIKPSAETHLLIIPKNHIATFQEINESNLFSEMLIFAQKLITELNLEKQYKLVINGGSNQIVPHFHLHLLGGKLKGHI